ncbi:MULTISPECIES: glutathione-disulfide reductase [Pandoraea]|uniref:Glutathione reductase n=1 Tax=Pandoraea cepalis TaxID=2508294 RepID=A0A5E4UR39_9BURK|nr:MULTISPECIES: glutathione-disulfide reductase [Pandoraea]QBC31726.1 glutathione-disulfide reductase [Pandoraea sp. XY-2]VVE02426.1 Glutathione amide reductase [Pandoraea cepalis]
MSQFDVDLFVIGAGSGGVRAARVAAQYGARVKVAEEFRVGGTCVIRGCVPKKLLVYASRFADEFEDAAGFGWQVPSPTFDWKTLIARKDSEIARLEGIYRANLERAGAELVEARAVVEGPHTVVLPATGERITARHILIATGGKPADQPHFIGREHAISSNEVFHLESLPERITIIGGGYIALEFAGVFAGLGSKVTLVHRGPHLLRGFDDDVRTALEAAYRDRGIEILLERTVARVDKAPSQLRVTMSDGSTHDTNVLLSAAGRVPYTQGLGLAASGVALNEKGAVIVDEFSRTNVPSIFAVGDVTDRVNLTPMAIREGQAFADTVFGERTTRVDHKRIPTAVFSTPEIGVVGLTESEARADYAQLQVYKASFRPLKATLSGRQERVLMKLLVDGATDKIVGAHMVGDHAGEQVQLLGVALTMGATKADFDRTLAVHPTAAEEWVTMRTPVA